MRIGLLAVDSQYPNLALMKIAAYHKAEGDIVEWYNPLYHYDKVYMAKVFTFTPDYGYYINADEVERGEFWPIEKIEASLDKEIFTPNFENEYRKILQRLLASR